jgi:hypothetical protein
LGGTDFSFCSWESAFTNEYGIDSYQNISGVSFFICRSVVSENEMAMDAFFCVATSLPDVCCVCGG